MKNVDIADALDEKSDLFDIGPGSIHTVTKDTNTIRFHREGEYVGYLSRHNGNWRFSASVKSHSYSYALDVNELLEISSIVKGLNENFNRKDGNEN